MSDPDQTKDPLGFNKLVAAMLIVALIFFGLPQIADKIVGGGHHGGGHGTGGHDDHHEVDPENPLNLAYPIAFKTEGGPKKEKVKVDLGTLLAAANPEGGKRSAAICASCHSFEKGGANGTGPNLWNIIGREKASMDGFKYSGALSGFGGTWTYEDLNEYLKNSQRYIPGTSMAQKVSKDSKRANILAYLQTLADTPVEFPAPVVMETALESAEETSMVKTEEAAEAMTGADDSAMMKIEDAKDTMMEKADTMMDKAEDAIHDAVSDAVDH